MIQVQGTASHPVGLVFQLRLKKKIYLIWALVGLCCCLDFPELQEQGASLGCGATGFSCYGARGLQGTRSSVGTARGSLVVVPRLWSSSCGTGGPTCSMACGIFPDPGPNFKSPCIGRAILYHGATRGGSRGLCVICPSARLFYPPLSVLPQLPISLFTCYPLFHPPSV